MKKIDPETLSTLLGYGRLAPRNREDTTVFDFDYAGQLEIKKLVIDVTLAYMQLAYSQRHTN